MSERALNRTGAGALGHLARRTTMTVPQVHPCKVDAGKLGEAP